MQVGTPLNLKEILSRVFILGAFDMKGWIDTLKKGEKNSEQAWCFVTDHLTPRYKEYMQNKKLVPIHELMELQGLIAAIKDLYLSITISYIVSTLSKFHLALSNQMLALKKNVLNKIQNVTKLNVKDLCDEVSKLINNNESHAKLKDLCKKQIEDNAILTNENKSLQDKLLIFNQLTEDKESLKIKVDYLTTENQNLLDKIIKQNIVIESYNNNIKVLETELFENQVKINNKKAKILQLKNTLNSLENDIESFKEMVLAVENIDSNLLITSDKLGKDVKATLVELKESKTELKFLLKEQEKNANEINRLTKEINVDSQIINDFLSKYQLKNRKNILLNSRLESFNIKETPSHIFGFKVTDSFLINFSKAFNNLIPNYNLLKLELFVKNNDDKLCENIVLEKLSKFCSTHGSKAIIWYRHYLTSKYFRNEFEHKLIKTNKAAQFYYTYINPTNSTDCVPLEEYAKMNALERRTVFKQAYNNFDKELKTRTTLFDKDIVNIQRAFSVLKSLLGLKQTPKEKTNFDNYDEESPQFENNYNLLESE